MNEVIYLCDRKKECNKSITCGGEYCNHTYDPEHAKNRTTDHPEVMKDSSCQNTEIIGKKNKGIANGTG